MAVEAEAVTSPRFDRLPDPHHRRPAASKRSATNLLPIKDSNRKPLTVPKQLREIQQMSLKFRSREFTRNRKIEENVKIKILISLTATRCGRRFRYNNSL